MQTVLDAAPAGVEIALAAELIGAGRRWAWNAERVFPAASTIKLAILVALARAVDAGRMAPADRRRVAPGDVVGGSGVLPWMEPRLSLSLADLAYLMIAVSDNTASNVLIDALGLDAIRETIADLGLVRTALNRRFLGRLPGPGEPENVTSAGDLVALLAAIADGRAASPPRCADMRRVLRLQQDRDRLARRLPNGADFGGKSGSLPGIAHDCGLIETPGGTLAIAVLTQGDVDPHAAHEWIGQVALALLEEAGPAFEAPGSSHDTSLRD